MSARIKGTIDLVFPKAMVEANQGTDYKYLAKGREKLWPRCSMIKPSA